MTVYAHQEPIKYIEIRNFLDEPTLARWLTTLDRMPRETGYVTDEQGRNSVTRMKRNENVWLMPPNDLGFEFRNLAWTREIKQARESMNDYLFLAHKLIDEGSFLYSVYTEGMYYDWHRDRTPYLTYNLVLESAEEGGEFEFSLDDQEPYRTVEQVANTANTLLIFPSFLKHRVRPVIKGQRRTLQYFMNCSHVASM
jgi:predicted 2-oxoglutarate/Fe(II)-dependent dioxygenase YbiX